MEDDGNTHGWVLFYSQRNYERIAQSRGSYSLSKVFIIGIKFKLLVCLVVFVCKFKRFSQVSVTLYVISCHNGTMR